MLKVHLVLVTKYRRKLLQGRIASDIKQWIVLLAKEKTWNIGAIETDKDHVHILLDYDTTECVCSIVKSIKQMTTYKVWQKYSSVLCKTYYKKQVFWSDGYFACSIGEVSASTIQHYIENQG